MYKIKLYVTYETPGLQSVIKKIKISLEKRLKQPYEFEVINLLDNPQLAEEEKIVATPLFVKISSGSTKKIIANLQDSEDLLSAIDLITQPD